MGLFTTDKYFYLTFIHIYLTMNTWNPEIYARAWAFATLAHKNQEYGGRSEGQMIPYINHISSVAMETIWALQHSTKTHRANLAIQCALLHDVIEDTPHTYSDILDVFGEEVANGVLALTKNDQLSSKEEKMQDSLYRIKQQPREVWIVKMADRITNLYHPPYYWTKEKLEAYQREAELIHEQLHEADAMIAERLKQKIEEYSKFIKEVNL